MASVFDSILGRLRGAVGLPEIQAGYDSGSPAQKANFQASVSADAVEVFTAPATVAKWQSLAIVNAASVVNITLPVAAATDIGKKITVRAAGSYSVNISGGASTVYGGLTVGVAGGSNRPRSITYEVISAGVVHAVSDEMAIAYASDSTFGIVNTVVGVSYPGADISNDNSSVTTALYVKNAIKTGNVGVLTTAASLTASVANRYISVNNAGSAVVITLPAPGSTPIGRIHTIARAPGATGAINITPASGQIQTLLGPFGSTEVLAVPGMYGQTLTYVNSGAAWLLA